MGISSAAVAVVSFAWFTSAVKDQSVARFHAAVLHGDVHTMRSLLDARVEHDELDDLKKTALHLAAIRGHADVTEQLLRHAATNPATLPNCPRYQPTPEGLAPPAFVCARDGGKRNALHWAAQKGHSAVSQLLLSERIDVYAQDSTGRTAAHWAALAGHVSVLDLLFKHGVGDVVDSSGKAPLHTAAQAGNAAIVKFFLDHRANVDARDSSGKTACHGAAVAGHVPAAQHLVHTGGSCCSVEDSQGFSPFLLASRAGHAPVAKLLLDAQAQSMLDFVPELHAVAAAGHVAVLELLLARRIAPDKPDAQGVTALHKMALAGHTHVASVLVNAVGTDKPDKCWASDNSGRTPFHVAASEGHVKIAEMFLAHGAAERHRDATDAKGRTAASLAVAHGHAEVLAKFLDASASPLGATSAAMLHEAAAAGHVPVVELLLSRKADRSTQDTNGLTAHDHAERAGHRKVMQLLSPQPKAPGKASVDDKGHVAGTSRSISGARPAAEL